MNDQLIVVSGIEELTPEDSFSETAKKTTRKKWPTAARRFASVILSMNFALSAVFYAAHNTEPSKLYEGATYGIFFGGMLNKPAQVQNADPITAPSHPVSADPITPETKETTEDNSAVPTIAEAFLKLYEYDLSLVPEGLYPIIPYDLSSEGDGELKLYNDTSLSVDINEYAVAEQTEKGYTGSEEPLVLIIHTHGTEAYSEDGVYGYSDTYNVPRSYDVTKNVVAIGRIMTRIMNENGVNTVQCDVMHDAESYLGAYERSAATIKDYLERYPSIKYVFDVHRDSVLMEDKTKTRPVTIANGKTAAQIMTVAGTDDLGTYYPHWEESLKLAAKLQVELNSDHLGLARAICLRGSSYNQELAPYSLLFEVGSCGNTISEATAAAEILAKQLCDLIKNGW
ncbi:MAG: stage II sporulation protein P [Clostridia bacterium]|nr:stage II sporulation protein P [Clostridia bacterium]